jgi:integrase
VAGGGIEPPTRFNSSNLRLFSAFQHVRTRLTRVNVSTKLALNMASIHKRKRSPYYWAAWRDSTGRLFYRSTKQTDRHKALSFALDIERAEKHATAGTLTESQARDIVGSIMERTQTGETLRNPKTADWLREWVDLKKKTETTTTRYSGVVEGFIKYLGPRATRPIVAITSRDIQGFYTLRGRTTGPSTVNVEGKILRAAFSNARRLNLISNSPADAVELPARDSIERGTFTPAEVQMLVNAAEGEWKTMILIGYYTSARLSECARVAWNDIDFVKGEISFPITKTKKKHKMPLHLELSSYLESIAGDTAGYVMPKLASVRISGRRGLSKHFIGLMEKAGLSTEKVKGAGTRELHKRSFHALRHGFTSALANAGVSPELRMKLTGHKSETVHQGYTHHEMDVLKTALAKLPKAKADK